MINFEASMIGALAQVFPFSPVRGCLFHLSKNIYRKVQDLGLQQMYLNDPVFRNNTRMIPVLSFVPIQDTVEAFEQPAQHCGNAEQPVLDYFETNYVGALCRGRRVPPRFEHAMWSVNTRVQDNIPRTNNHLEGWHTRFTSMFNSPHPSIWQFIDILKRDFSHNHMLMAQMLAGAPPPTQKRIYRAVNTRIQNLVQGYQIANLIPFLRGISYNLA